MCGGGGGPALLPGAPGSPDHHVRGWRGPSSAAQGSPGALTTMCGGGGAQLCCPGPSSPDHHVRERRGPALLPGPLEP